MCSGIIGLICSHGKLCTGSESCCLTAGANLVNSGSITKSRNRLAKTKTVSVNSKISTSLFSQKRKPKPMFLVFATVVCFVHTYYRVKGEMSWKVPLLTNSCAIFYGTKHDIIMFSKLFHITIYHNHSRFKTFLLLSIKTLKKL